MRAIAISIVMLAAGLWALPAWADIYMWEDANGVKHISNLNPPPEAKVFLRTKPNPSEPSAEKRDARRQENAEQDADLLEREIRLREKEAALERRLAETEAKVEDARDELERAHKKLEDVQARYEHDRAKNRWYAAGPLIYRPVYSRWRYDRYKRHPSGRHPGHSDRRRYGITFQTRPFQLGAVHIPLYNAHDRYRRPKPHGAGSAALKHRHRGHAQPRHGGRHRDGRRH